jgi:predicted sulfurtransferase
LHQFNQGINGQFSIPTTKLSHFQHIITRAHPSFTSINFNVGDSYEEGESLADITTFKRLSVKVKGFILTDGLSEGHDIDWKDHGRALLAQDWHKEVEAIDKSTTTNTILLGMYLQHLFVFQ